MTSELSLWVRLKDNNHRRFWIFIVNFLLLFFFLPLRLIAYGVNQGRMFQTLQHKEALGNILVMLCRTELGPNEYMIAYLFLAAVLSAVEGYSYLYQMRKVDMLHSQPVSCRRRFFSIYLNGALYFLVPYVINTILAIFVAMAFRCMNLNLFGAFLLTMLFNGIAFLAFYHTVILAVVLTGNYIACFCGIAALFGVEWAFRSLIYTYCTFYFKTFSVSAENQIMNPMFSVLTIYLQGVRQAKYPSFLTKDFVFGAESILKASYQNMLLILIIGVITLGVAYVAYYHRPVEEAGKPVVLSVVKPIAKIFAIILLSLGLGWLMASISGNNFWLVIVGLIVGGIVAQCLMEVIYEARISAVIERLWQFGIAMVGVAIFFSVFKFDLVKFDQSLPKPENVESYAVVFAPQEMESYMMGDVRTAKYVQDRMYLTDISMLEKLAAADYFHQTGEKMLLDQENAYTTVEVLFRMRNGKQRYRTYYIEMANQEELMNQFFAQEEFRNCVFPILSEDFYADTQEINININGVFKEYISPSKDLLKQIQTAYQQDMEYYTYTMVSTTHQNGIIYVNDKKLDDGYGYSIPVYDAFVHVNQVLDQNGFSILSDVQEHPINKIEIYQIPADDGDYTLNDNNIIIWDPEEIEDILEYAEETSFGSSWKGPKVYYTDLFVYGTMDNGGGITFSFTRERGLPDWLQERMGYGSN